MLAGSEPPCGSVRPKQPITSPAAMSGSQRWLLLLGAVGEDRVHAQRGLHRDEAADAAVAALELLADQPVADRVQAASAVLLGKRRAEQAQLRDFRHQFLREAPLVERVADDRQHPLVGEAGHGVLHRALLLRQQGTDVVQVVGVEGHGDAFGGKRPLYRPAVPAGDASTG
jgi:hypothetical protein